MYMMGLLSLQKQLAQSRYGIGRILWLEGLPFRFIAIPVGDIDDGQAQFVGSDDIEAAVADHDGIAWLQRAQAIQDTAHDIGFRIGTADGRPGNGFHVRRDAEFLANRFGMDLGVWM